MRVRTRARRAVLAGFQVGLAEKQVARRLGISVHTVHVYAKSLYRHFHVNSRAELLGRLLNDRSSGPGRTG
jgi:DNA-binding NarL/FixJ family response regulator